MVLFSEAVGGANAARQLIERRKFTIVNLRREDELADELRQSPSQRNRFGSCEGRRLPLQANNCSLPRKKWVYIYKRLAGYGGRRGTSGRRAQEGMTLAGRGFVLHRRGGTVARVTKDLLL